LSAKEAKIFISYSQADSDFALKLGKDLRSAGANIWIDQLDIGTGERWDRAVQKALEACGSLVIILSPAAMDSDNVMDEAAFAFDENKQILPVLYKDCNINFRLRRLQRSDFTNNYDTGLKQLCKALEISPPPSKTKPQKKRTTTTASPATVSLGPASPKIKLRSTPIRDLSENAVKKMLKKNGFYDRNLNMDGQGFANQFKLMERQGESLIIDENSGLTWQQSGSKPLAYREAQAYIEELNTTHYAGYSDWRLPTLEEAMSLMEPNDDKDFRYINPIFDRQYSIWTADKGSASTVWVVSFGSGDCDDIRVFNVAYVRAVR